MKKCLCLLLCILILGGCSSHGTEEQLMVVMLGVDESASDGIQLTVKAPSFSGGQDSSDGGSAGYLSFSVQAETFAAALTLLSAASPRNLNFTQTRMIIISADALDHLPGLFQSLSLIEGMRSQASVSICRSNAGEIINAKKPVVGTRLSRYIDTTWETGIRAGYIPDSTLIRVQTKILGTCQDALITHSAMNQNPSHQQNAVQTSVQSTDSLAGQLPQQGGSTAQWIGAVAMNGNRIAGFLTGFETTLCRFLSKEIRELLYEIDGCSVLLTGRFGPFIAVRQQDNTCTLQIRANLNVLPQLGAQVNLANLQQALVEDIRSLVHTLQRMQSDALGFGGCILRHTHIQSQWQPEQWKTVYHAANVDVQVQLTLMDE